jgi:hypothetical protein
MSDCSIKISRNCFIANEIVFIDGIGGCGKTMLAPIIASMQRVELLSYAYEIEHVNALHHLNKLDIESAGAVTSMQADLKIYNIMQSRDVNFRINDLSSVFKSVNSMKYIRRIFSKGDSSVLQSIKDQSPILLLTTHGLVAFGKPTFLALEERMLLIEVVRHPLYMIIQNERNFSSIIGFPNDFSVYFQYAGMYLPFFSKGWEDLYLASNSMDRAIYYISNFTALSQINRSIKEIAKRVVTIPFEKFVIDPFPYLDILSKKMNSSVTSKTLKMLKKQNVPRNKYSDSIDLPAYRRCGWKPPRENMSEMDELEIRRQYAVSLASPSGIKELDRLCNEYENTYLGGKLRPSGSGSYVDNES